MGYEHSETRKVDAALKGDTFVTIHCAHQTWQSPDGKRKGWTVIIEHMNALSKVQTYDESLTEHGMKPVEFYKNSQGMRCIRKG